MKIKSLLMFTLLSLSSLTACNKGKSTYTVTWNNYDGTTLEVDKNVEEGSTPTYNGATPKREKDEKHNYTFKGWSPSISEVRSNITYTAEYTTNINEYTVTWKNYDGTTLEVDRYVKYGTTPSYDGVTPFRGDDSKYSYTFKGWSPNIKEVTSDVTYTAEFTPIQNRFEITFKDDDGSVLETKILNKGEIPSYSKGIPYKAKTPKYTYSFKSWDKDLTPCYEDKVYTAVYDKTINKYNVTFKNVDGSILQSKEVEYDATPTYEGETPTKSSTDKYDFTFDKWEPNITPVSGDTVYTASYKSSIRKYTITWVNYDDTTLDTEIYDYGSTPSFKKSTPTKKGDAQYSYTFNGWDTLISEVTSNKTYKATYTQSVNKYKIKWNNYDDSLIKEDTVEYGKTPVYSGNTPKKPSDDKYSYTFNGWDPEITTVTGNMIYTATYNQTDRKYILNLHSDTNMGTVSGGGEDYEYNQSITITATPKEDYRFVGWYLDSSYSSLLTTTNPYTFNIVKDTNLYAKFEKYKYKINYNLNGGTNHLDNPSKYTAEDEITFKDPSKNENTFVKWTDSNGNKITGISKGSTGDITINANWKVNQYSVTLHVNDSTMGSVSGGGTFDYGSEVTITATPNNGYKFIGWYRDSSYSIQVSTSKLFTYILSNVNVDLYAKFGLETYTITYNLNGGTNNPNNPSSYTVEDSISFLEPTKTGNSFVKWTDKNGNKITGISKGTTGNITINANWEVNQYSVTLHVNDSTMGSVSGGGTFDYGSSVTVVASPNNGYSLEGWYTDSSYSNKVSSSKTYRFTLSNENVELYAKFKEGSSEWDEKHGVIPVINTTDNTLTYGLFPQTIVSPKTESSLITELNKLVPSTYNYIYYNDEYYVRVSFAKPYESDYTFSDGTTIVSFNMYYFKCEPIKWNIISNTDGTYYLDCTNILNGQRYGEVYNGTKSKTDYKGETATVYANNYKYSDIRTYLNTTFYNQAFFLNNEYIIDTTVDNSASTTDSSTNEYACENTVDKLFLRSYKDLSSISESNIAKKVTDFALANHAYMNTSSSYLRKGEYWTRSPCSFDSNCPWNAYFNGSLDYIYVDWTNRGVSPALNINLTNLAI